MPPELCMDCSISAHKTSWNLRIHMPWKIVSIASKYLPYQNKSLLCRCNEYSDLLRLKHYQGKEWLDGNCVDGKPYFPTNCIPASTHHDTNNVWTMSIQNWQY